VFQLLVLLQVLRFLRNLQLVLILKQKIMTLGQFKNYVKGFEMGKLFNYGISEPFSWRGSYNEVAFEILTQPMSREQILNNIEYAKNGV